MDGKKTLQTQPYKGAQDYYPQDMRVRNYIFETWRNVCKRYGYEEYDGPFIEEFDVYAAKSGQEIVNEQLYSFEDRGGRKVAIRPEMTPTLSRMVAQKIKTLPRPIKWFSIPNLWRYEKPQRGRQREFFQLNVDVFGVNGVEADLEIVLLSTDIMKEFGAKEGMYEIRLGNRRLTNDVLRDLGVGEQQIKFVIKVIDKKNKLPLGEFVKYLSETKDLSKSAVSKIVDFLEKPDKFVGKIAGRSQGAQEIIKLLELCQANGIGKLVKYDPCITRGLDYYTGNVFEQFDLNPANTRAMYGGGRYDNLVEIFTGEKLSGVGFGWGDAATKLFLESWGLIPEIKTETEYLITVWPSKDQRFLSRSLEIAKIFRNQGKNVSCWLETESKIEKQLKYADKMGIKKAVIVGEKELAEGTVIIKDMAEGKQETRRLES